MTEAQIESFALRAAAYCLNDFSDIWKFVGEPIRAAFIDAAILRLHSQRDNSNLHSDDVQTLRDAVTLKMQIL
jgi:hypothetical protein